MVVCLYICMVDYMTFQYNQWQTNNILERIRDICIYAKLLSPSTALVFFYIHSIVVAVVVAALQTTTIEYNVHRKLVFMTPRVFSLNLYSCCCHFGKIYWNLTRLGNDNMYRYVYKMSDHCCISYYIFCSYVEQKCQHIELHFTHNHIRNFVSD